MKDTIIIGEPAFPRDRWVLVLVLFLVVGPWPLRVTLLGQPALRLDSVLVQPDHPVISISLRESVRSQLIESRGVKVALKGVPMLINGQRATARELRLRGRSSLGFRRKSFTVELEEKIPVPAGDTTLRLRKFYLVSLNMDRHYFRNRLAFACLSRLGLFNLAHGYVEVRINRQTEGVYLLLQRPEDYVFDDLQGAYYLRRGHRDAIEKDEWADGVPDAAGAAFRQRYHSIFHALDSLSGQALYAYLDERMNVEDYMRWMAFNYWVRNGDYTDEVFFYLNRHEEDARFHFLGWDYDDIFANYPHEGPSARAQWLGDAMIFSAECKLDRAIGNDDVLYRRYLRELGHVLRTLDPAWTADLCAQIYAELGSFYRKRHIVRMARFDRGGETSHEGLRRSLNEVYEKYLLARRAEILDRLGEAGR